MTRSIDLTTGGWAYVVTDLHGDWDAYVRYRDDFLEKYRMGQAQYLIFLGDLIHYYGDAADDYSIDIVLDIIRLRDELGRDVVVALLGNHELPHIYGVTLSKGHMMFTPPFEHALGDQREAVMAFFREMPFVVRTVGGTMMTHAGASAYTASDKAAEFILNYDHSDLLSEANRLIHNTPVTRLVAETFGMDERTYLQTSQNYLAVESADDPRYLDLVRGLIVSNLEEWETLWEFFFTGCELRMGKGAYGRILDAFLEAFSRGFEEQKALVTGHITVKGGSAVIADHQLRIASWEHAQPKRQAKYLLFDTARQVENARDLLPDVHPMP